MNEADLVVERSREIQDLFDCSYEDALKQAERELGYKL